MTLQWNKSLFGGLSLAALTMSLTASAQSPAPSVPPAEVPRYYTLAQSADADRIESDIRTLVSFGTRHTLSETGSQSRGIGAARRWIFNEFERISAACGGCLEVMMVSDTVEGERRIPESTEVASVIAIQRGTLDPDRYVIMSGDIDSRVSDVMDAESDAPGANDNASGVAGTLEAARLLSQHTFAGSIVYAALSGEEQGLFGGQILADKTLREDWTITGVINNDMIGNIAGIDGVIDNSIIRVFSEGPRVTETPEERRLRRYTGGEVDSPSRNLARYIDAMAEQYMPNLDVMMVYRLDRFRRGGHHRPFNDVGYPAVRIMEAHEHYHRQHQDLREEEGIRYGDTLEGVDFDFAAKATGLNAIVLAGLAAAPPPPAEVTVEGAVSPDTTLRWQRPKGRAADNLAGYRVHWRLTTSPTWTNSRWAGDVDAFTLENVVIDNYFFGVSAVARDGSESPVVFPGPNGAFPIGAPIKTD